MMSGSGYTAVQLLSSVPQFSSSEIWTLLGIYLLSSIIMVKVLPKGVTIETEHKREWT